MDTAMKSRSGSLMLTWLIFVIFHAALMFIDWNLRDHDSIGQPMPGGIPIHINTILCWASLAAFGGLTWLYLPRSWSFWIKIPLGLILTVIAFAATIYAWLIYVLENGIDTL